MERWGDDAMGRYDGTKMRDMEGEGDNVIVGDGQQNGRRLLESWILVSKVDTFAT